MAMLAKSVIDDAGEYLNRWDLLGLDEEMEIEGDEESERIGEIEMSAPMTSAMLSGLTGEYYVAAELLP
jgi:hypothetical protein